MKIDHGGWVVVYMMNKPKQTKKSFSCLNINSHPQQCVKMSIKYVISLNVAKVGDQ